MPVTDEVLLIAPPKASRRRTLFLWSGTGLFAFGLILLNHSLTNMRDEFRFPTFIISEQSIAEPENTPIILLGTTYFGNNKYWFEWAGFNHLRHKNCPKQCEVSTNASDFDNASLVVFSPYAGDNTPENSLQLPTARNISGLERQKWAYYNLESPRTEGFVSDDYARRIDWTITYRSDSSFQVFYDGQFRTVHTGTSDELEAAIQRKKRPIAAVISNYVPHRQDFIAILRQYIPVDVYGKVSGIPCPGDVDANHPNRTACRENIADKYWFYLAIENAACTDYVTEKLYEQFNYWIVPVAVAGGFPDTYAPPGSFIRYNVSEGGVRNLARKLRYLQANPDEYKKYFTWKTDLEKPVLPPRPPGGKWICNLCEALHDPHKAESILSHRFNSHDEFRYWWAHGKCSIHRPGLG